MTPGEILGLLLTTTGGLDRRIYTADRHGGPL
jgi:hypothetical protein